MKRFCYHLEIENLLMDRLTRADCMGYTSFGIHGDLPQPFQILCKSVRLCKTDKSCCSQTVDT